jgi:hypothetical protein
LKALVPSQSWPQMILFPTSHDPAHEIPDNKQCLQDMLMGYHNMQFGHIPFDQLQQAVQQEILASKLLIVKFQSALVASFGKAKHVQPW